MVAFSLHANKRPPRSSLLPTFISNDIMVIQAHNFNICIAYWL